MLYLGNVNAFEHVDMMLRKIFVSCILITEGEYCINENRAGLGYQDFETVRKQQIFYIDKTDFILEWWEMRIRIR